jgi:hypothetical protein
MAGRKNLDSRLRGKDGETVAVSSTPKELRHIAQGCRASRLPWGRSQNTMSTLKGLRHHERYDDVTPLGYMNECDAFPG